MKFKKRKKLNYAYWKFIDFINKNTQMQKIIQGRANLRIVVGKGEKF